MNQLLTAFITVALAISSAPSEQAGSSAEIVSRAAGLAGVWDGTLEYVDYGDNETRVTLGMSVEYRETPGGAAYDIEFREPDGRLVTDAGRLERLPSGEVVLGADAYDVVRFETADSGGGFTLVLTMRGEDGGRPAELRQVIEHAENQLVVRKQVRYDGETEYFTRNEVKLFRRS